MEPAVSSGPTPAAALLRDVILGGTTVDLLHCTLAATRLVFGQVGSHDLVSVVDSVHQDEVQQLSDTYMQQIQERESAISSLTENLSKV